MGIYSREEIRYVQAQYRGLVSLVDTWFGKPMGTLDDLDLGRNTAVFLISDHGTNFCDNPRNVIGKPANSMYPGLMALPFLARLPDEAGAGRISDALVYNLDLVATIYELTGANPSQGLWQQPGPADSTDGGVEKKTLHHVSLR